MDIVEYLTPLLGSRQGTNRLRIMPTDEYRLGLRRPEEGPESA